MALYDAALSCTFADLEYLQAIVQKCTSLWELAGKGTEEAFAPLVRLGPMPDPWDKESHTVPELENQFFYVQIGPPEEGYTTVRGPEQHGTARINIDPEIRIHRQIRESEDLWDAWAFFCDRAFHFVETQLYDQAKIYDPALWVAGTNMMARPGLAPRDEIAGQGDRLFAMFSVALGQQGGGEGE